MGGLGLAALALLGLRTCSAPLLSPYPLSRSVHDRDGRLMRLTLASDDAYRLFVPLDQVSPDLVEATLLYEDRAFAWHPGVNPWALLKAALQTYVRGGPRRGGSTITMQLARLHYHLDTRTPGGKLAQIGRALELEARYPKRELLEAYLTIAPYGGNVYGVGAASLVYFGKEPSQLTRAEAMALAVMPQSPSSRGPAAGVENAGLRAARGKLGAAWLAAHPTSRPGELVLDRPLAMRSSSDLPFEAPHAVRDALLRDGRARVRLALDRDLQHLVERHVTHYLGRRRAAELSNTAVLVVEAKTLEVLATVGSADFADASISGQVDGTRAKRSPGSALKPLVYARALDEGLIHPRTVLKDVPQRFGAYNPENFDNEYLGPLSATDALVRSRNVPAVYLESRLQQGLHATLAAAGVAGLRPKDHYGVGIVLGGVEVTLEELAGLYVALANGGVAQPLRRALADRGEPAARRLFSPEAAALTLQMLQANERGEAERLPTRDALPVAWKTGTSYAYRDAWTVGVAGPYVVAVWVGNFDGRGNPSFVGRTAAAPLFFELVDALRSRSTPGSASPESQAPLSLVQVEVCSVSGQLPTPLCPRHTRTQFIPGVSPLHACEIHRPVHVDVVSGDRLCQADPPRTRTEVYEIWPSDVAGLFARAGLPRREPPPLRSACDLDAPPPRTRPPLIVFPQPSLTYTLRASSREGTRIPLLASADSDARRLRWFAGTEYLGEVGAGHALDWPARAGQHELRVVDERGASSAVSVRVEWAQ